MISKKLFTGGINGDDSDVLIQANEYLNASNIRFATTESGKIGEISNVEGNVIKSTTINNAGNSVAFTLPAGTNTTIGAVDDTPRRRIFFFNKNSNGNHGVYCYDGVTDRVYTVLLSSQVVGGLGFSGDVHSSSVIGNLLYWVGDGRQRRVNVEAGIKLNHPTYSTTVAPYVLDKNSSGDAGTTHLASSVISLIRNQPWKPLIIAKFGDNTYTNNFIKNEAFQFAYRFVYRDFEVSTFSPLSDLANYEIAGQDFKLIRVTVPTEQKIEQDVIKVEIAVRFVVGGKYFIVKTFESGFTAHNAGTALTFDFYNDTVGTAVDDASAFKQFDAIPVQSRAMEIARNRLFLGNNVDGYDTPSTTSMQRSVTTNTITNVTGQWFRALFTPTGQPVQQRIHVLFIQSAAINIGYWRTVPEQETAPSGADVPFASMVFIGTSSNDVQTYINTAYGPSTLDQLEYVSTVSISGVTPPSLVGARAFKSDSVYRLGIVFYDEAGRKCGVVTNDGLKVTTPDRLYTNIAYTTGINWSLSNTNAAAEIPTWARYYSIVMTKGLRTSFFMQLRADSIKYVTKKDTGEYQLENSYNATHFGVAVEVKSLFSIGYGYQYQEGDLIKIYPDSGPTVTLSVKDTFGAFVICDNFDLTGKQVLYEIYTPYISSINEPYFERAQTFRVLNPGLPSRAYSSLTGTIEGDITLMNRTGPYLVEAMSPRDLSWRNWNTNAGRSNIVLTAKSAAKPVSVSFSNVIVLGSQTNGLSTFDVLDQTQLPQELASIQKLQLISKIESEGTVMLAIGEQETASMYLGESQVFDNTGSSFLAKSSGVIGNVNVLRGSYGTINPESVVRYMGNVYWFDANRGAVASYSTNGLFPISQNKMSKYFRKIGQDVLSKGLKFYGGVDPFHNEILMCAPRKSVIPEGERLRDMIVSGASYNISSSSTPTTVPVTLVEECEYMVAIPPGVEVRYNGEWVNGKTFIANGVNSVSITSANPTTGILAIFQIVRGRYDIYDGQGGTWAYQPGLDKWTTSYAFRPEWMTYVMNRLVTFRSGMPYVHNSSNYNNFYGYQYESALAFTHNDAGNVTKVYESVSVEGDTPDLVHIRTEVPFLQSSDIVKSDFAIKEGVSYSSIFRDRLTPGGFNNESSLVSGEVMRGEVGKFQVMYESTSIKKMKFCNVGFIPSRGHTTTPQNAG